MKMPQWEPSWKYEKTSTKPQTKKQQKAWVMFDGQGKPLSISGKYRNDAILRFRKQQQEADGYFPFKELQKFGYTVRRVTIQG